LIQDTPEYDRDSPVNGHQQEQQEKQQEIEKEQEQEQELDGQTQSDDSPASAVSNERLNE
jgi:hypothetical protein